MLKKKDKKWKFAARISMNEHALYFFALQVFIWFKGPFK